ncbi:alanyl-tRNA editing protein AlaX-L, partial [Clostridium saudiense]|nr:alanyl-tRNA editing protein AlaX-L [Clostridium saudiense]
NIISKSAEEIKEYQNENRMLKVELSKYEIKEMIESADKIGDISVIKKIYEKSDLKHIGKIAEKLVENEKTIALFAVKSVDKSNLIFASSKDNKNVDMNELLKDAITLIDGRGGGSKFLAQGGGKKSNNLESTIDYAFMKIKNIKI